MDRVESLTTLFYMHVALLLFITVIAPTLTFGAVYSTNMDNRIGAVECILATCWTGCFFSLFGGMPIVIVGSTGKFYSLEMAKASTSTAHQSDSMYPHSDLTLSLSQMRQVPSSS